MVAGASGEVADGGFGGVDVCVRVGGSNGTDLECDGYSAF